MTQTIEQLTARVRELEGEKKELQALLDFDNARLDQIEDELEDVEYLGPFVEGIKVLKTQLAASQLHAEQLREALQTFIDEHEECTDADDWMAMLCSIEAHHVAEEALAIPQDTSALHEYVKDIESSRDWYKRRVDLLQEWQSKMRDPERTIVCDIIANGLTMPEGGRYEVDTSALDSYVAKRLHDMACYKGLLRIQVEELTRQCDLAVEALEWAADVLPPSDPGGIGGCDCPVCRALEAIKGSEAMAQGEK